MSLDSSRAARAGEGETLLRRLKLLAACLFLAALAFSVDPGRIIGDTKIDLALNPLGFLERALHLWDSAYFGQLQNQAYGYLFPNGPFHALFLALDMPAWMVQRLWMAALMCAAFLGVVLVARALGIGSTNTQIVAGLAYALSPRVLTLLSYNSAELQPTMLLPWVLLPLIYGTRQGSSPARAALLSATAFALCGGTNAASELAVLVLPLLYLLTRSNGRRKWRLLSWWLFAIFCVSLWWLAPLLIMGRYVFDFMPYTEDAATTTGVTSLLNAVRGSSNWMGYVPVQGQPSLPAGAELANAPLLIAVTALVAGLGLAGLANRRIPERTFLIVTLLTGTAIVVSGYTGDLTGPFAETMRSLYDGELSPFRNVHKFDAVIRLPLVLGLAYLPLAIANRTAVRPGKATRILGLPPGLARKAAASSCAVAVAASLTPIATVGIATRGGFEEVPGYWQEAIDWLDGQGGDGMTMAVPGSARGEYTWGRPLDEPMQPLMEGRWTNHQIIPWGSAGASRMLHEIDQRLSSGRGSSGLTDTLARMGVSYLLVRNDLERFGAAGAWPARVHQALEDSPGITRVEGFGPDVGALDQNAGGRWYDQPYQAVEVYAVEDPAPLVGTVPQEGVLRVNGGPEALLTLAEEGLLTDDRPVLLGEDPGADLVSGEHTVATDTSRRREVIYSDVRRNVSATLTADDELERGAPAPDVTDPAWQPYTSSALYQGIAGVTASSSDAGALASPSVRDPGRSAFAALDGNASTAWRSSGFSGAVGEWLEVQLEEPRDVTGLTVAFEEIPGEPPPAEIDVVTDTGSVRATVDPSDEAGTQELPVPPGETTRVRIRVASLAWEPEFRFGSRVGITQLNVPGVEPSRTLDMPGTGGAHTAVLTGSTGTVPGCMRGSSAWVCDPALSVRGEDARTLDRSFELAGEAASGPHQITGRVVATNPRTLENTANRAGGFPEVTSSSAAAEHPGAIGRNAFDDDSATIWYPDPEDPEPSLEVDLGEEADIDGILFGFPREGSVTSPIRVTLETDSTSREAWLDGDGLLGFDTVRTDHLRLTFDPPAGQPLEIATVLIPGVDRLEPLEELSGGVSDACGGGPVLRVNGERVETRLVDASASDLLSGQPVGYEACTAAPLVDGSNRVVVDAGTSYRVESAVVSSADGAETVLGTDEEVEMAEVASVDGWGPSQRRVTVEAAEDSYLVVNENFNEGWQAVLDTQAGDSVPLEPVRLDGWRQAWELPAGASGQVVLTYEPDSAYHMVLGAGGILAFLVAAAALFPRRVVVGSPRGGRHWPGVGGGRIAALPLALLALLFGLWVAGAAGLAVFAATLAASWLLSLRSAAAAPGGARRPGPLLRAARALSGPWVAVGALTLAGCALALGGYLNQNLPFHDISGILAEPLRGWVPQLLCLPALARLVVSLWRFEGGGPGGE